MPDRTSEQDRALILARRAAAVEFATQLLDDLRPFVDFHDRGWPARPNGAYTVAGELLADRAKRVFPLPPTRQPNVQTDAWAVDWKLEGGVLWRRGPGRVWENIALVEPSCDGPANKSRRDAIIAVLAKSTIEVPNDE